MSQVWKPVFGYEKYEVSNDGQIRSWVMRARPDARRETPRILTLVMAGQDRRPAISLSKNGKSKRFYIHTLVLEAFVGPRPNGCEACHNDGNVQNNCVDNLRWDTHRRNERNKQEHGTVPVGERNGMAKLSTQDVEDIRELSHQGERHDEIAKRFHVTPGTINRIANGKRWANAGGPIHTEDSPYQNKKTKTNYFALHPEVAKGENNGRAILDPDRVRQIRQRVRQGEKRSDLALEYGISVATVHHIVNGRLWRHID